MRLFSTHQPQIFAYILTLLPAWHDAEEVMQETSVVLWNSFGEFEPGISTKEAAEQLGRPAGTVYKALTRIRRALFKCIERTLSAEGPA